MTFTAHDQQSAILVDEAALRFHLKTPSTSYVMGVVNGGWLAHLYWGKAVRRWNESAPVRYADRGFSGNTDKNDRTFSLDTAPLEYPSYGSTDFRDPAFHFRWEDGASVSEFRYKGYEVKQGRRTLEGLPHVYTEQEAEAETLTIQLYDELKQVSLYLDYVVFPDYDALTRSVRVVNEGDEAFTVEKLTSANVDFRSGDWELLSLYGAHNRERDVERGPIRHGSTVLESRRGASSHQLNPFFALVSPDATETNGDVYGFSFVYSGSWRGAVEVDQFSTSRVQLGLGTLDFSWEVTPGSSFQTPEVVMVYSSAGLGPMSRTYHRLYNERLIRGSWKGKERPILINNWEATYFDFDEQKLLAIADEAADAGIELFVLDDGWFGRRNDDTTSLGDWYPDTKKLPNGLKGAAEKITSKGLRFGLWMEPEMVSTDSELYRSHPDWCLHVPGRRRSESRNQLVLDYGNPDVRSYIVERLTTVLEESPVSYVKWDMNRNMTEASSRLLPAHRQKETAHRYMLGVYEVMETITTRFPEILFESCAGGGGRFDPGMLYYMPQAWTSDNTDAVSRTRIHYGTSLVYPPSAMGSHVSAVPNHQVGRITPLQTRGHMAMDMNLGYELDPTTFTAEEKAEVSRQTARYKELRPLMQFGELYRLESPYEGESYAVLRTNADKSEAVFLYMHRLADANAPFIRVRLDGLDPDADYRVVDLDQTFGGDELMYTGLDIPMITSDFQSFLWKLEKIT
ncbi:alpha-galactosidase [Bacillus daqingensis]|uniref:Alpha-galactosidase n=1 Tax=Bacillus daqingensis TaxID=872396 RepID=A0ABV9NUK5_9BACI